MNFNPSQTMEIVENLMKKIIHDISNPMTGIINACEIIKIKQNTVNQSDFIDLNSISSLFTNSSNSLYRKVNLFRYIFIDGENLRLSDEDDEIFIEIIHEFENRYSYNLNYDFHNSSVLYKKIILLYINVFSHFISNGSISTIKCDKELKNFSFIFSFSLENQAESSILNIIDFFNSDLTFDLNKNFLNPIDIFSFYFKIFLKSKNFYITHKKSMDNIFEISIMKNL